MPEPATTTPERIRLPGLDSAATPLIGLGLGLTGLLLGFRPRFAPWSLALTAAAALLYRDPDRVTPQETSAIFAPADGTVIDVEDLYEHRFLHTDAVRIAIAVSPLDVPAFRSPAAGTIAYLERAPGAFRPLGSAREDQHSDRQYIGIKAAWGPILLAIVAGPLTGRINCRVSLGEQVGAGARLGVLRFGGRVDLLLPRDALEEPPEPGQRLQAGVSQMNAPS